LVEEWEKEGNKILFGGGGMVDKSREVGVNKLLYN